jgi:Inhibitor of apoptosis-promoting Bax1
MESSSAAVQSPALTRDDVGTLLGQTMGLVAVTAGLFALGAYLGRDVSHGWSWLFFVASFAALLGINFAAARSEQLAVTLLFGFGVLIGLAVAPTISFYASADPKVVWEAGGATALFVAGFGAAGYATRRDLSGIARFCFWALIALIVFGDRRDLRPDSERLADLRDSRPCDLRRADGVRLPAPAPHAGHEDGAAPRGVDLPRHPQRVPPAAVALRQR